MTRVHTTLVIINVLGIALTVVFTLLGADTTHLSYALVGFGLASLVTLSELDTRS